MGAREKAEIACVPQVPSARLFTLLQHLNGCEDARLARFISFGFIDPLHVFPLMRIGEFFKDRFGFLLAGGMTIGLFVNLAINIGVVTAILPVTGRPLPFLSYGGSSLLMSSCAIAVLLNLSRRIQRDQTR